MASQDHIGILMTGADAWNNWRLSNLSIKPDLSEITFDLDVHVEELKRYNFYRTNFTKCTFFSKDMRKCMLKEANFSGSYLSFCDFSSSNLQGANFADTFMYGCCFSRADLSMAKLDNAT
jgi:uncharacterized protein YjbI with pentapeptide repeats